MPNGVGPSFNEDEWLRFKRNHPTLAKMIETIHSDPGLSPMPLGLGIPSSAIGRSLLSKRLRGKMLVGDKLKSLLYRFQEESAPAPFRRGGEYYYAGQPKAEINTGYFPGSSVEGGRILKTVPSEIANPVISYSSQSERSSLSLLGGSDTTRRVSAAVTKLITGDPSGIGHFRKVTGATSKEIDLAMQAKAPKDALLDLAKQKLLKRAGADAFIRTRLGTPEVFVTDPKKLGSAKYYLEPSKLGFLPE